MPPGARQEQRPLNTTSKYRVGGAVRKTRQKGQQIGSKSVGEGEGHGKCKGESKGEDRVESEARADSALDVIRGWEEIRVTDSYHGARTGCRIWGRF